MKRDPVIIIVVALVVSAMLAVGVYKSRRSPDQTKTSGAGMKGQSAPARQFICPIFAAKPCCSTSGQPGASPAK